MQLDEATGIYYNGKSMTELKGLVCSSDRAIFDLCGTVIKPDYSMKLFYKAGIVKSEFWDTSNVYLAKNLAGIMAENAIKNKSPKEAAECLSYCGRLARLFVQQGFGMTKEEVIRKFSEETLNGIPQSALEEAASYVANYAYDNSLEAISQLAKSGKEIVFVTLALGINAKACLSRMGIEGVVYGNDAGAGGAKLLNTQDKYEIIFTQIKKSNEPVIIVGSNGNDLLMFKALDDSKRDGIKVAVNSENQQLLKSADVSANFKSLCSLIENAQS